MEIVEIESKIIKTLEIESPIANSGAYIILIAKEENSTYLKMPSLSVAEQNNDWSISFTFDHWGISDLEYQTLFHATKIGDYTDQYIHLWCVQAYGYADEFQIRIKTKEGTQYSSQTDSDPTFFQDNEIYYIIISKSGSIISAAITRDSDQKLITLSHNIGSETFDCDLWAMGGKMVAENNADDCMAPPNILKDFSSNPNYWAMGQAYKETELINLVTGSTRYDYNSTENVAAIINRGSKGDLMTATSPGFWRLLTGSVNPAPSGINIISRI